MFRSTRFFAVSLFVCHIAFYSESFAQTPVTIDSEGRIVAPGQQDEAGSTSYVNETFGWSVTVPPTWSLAYGGWDPSLVNFDTPDGNAMFGVCVIEHREFMGKSLDEVADIWLNKWVDSLNKPHVLLSREIATLPTGLRAVEVFHEIGGGVVGKSRTLIIAAGNCVYVLVAEAYLDDWQGVKSDFDQFVDSFKIPPADTSLQSLAEPTLPDDTKFSDYLYQGRLADGASELKAAIKANPEDDESRFCLGIVQFGLAIEHLVQDLNRHGFLTERTFGAAIPPELRQLFPDHADPEPFSNEVLREMIQTWVTDVTLAEATLAEIKQPSVKLRLRPGLIKLDPVGQGNAVNAAQLLLLMFPQQQNDQIKKFGLTLDRGDVHWLRGYLHIQAALGEGLLAHDFRPLVETCAHQMFEKVETPYTWLLEERRKSEFSVEDYHAYESPGDEYEIGDLWHTNFRFEYVEPPATVYLDAVAFIGQCLDLAVIEPQRFDAVLDHLEQTVENAQEMWKHILAETDDDNEWIPNSNQRGSISVQVTQSMIDTWLDTLAETQRILRGDKLVPFWRDLLQKRPMQLVRGLNIRKIFEEPPSRTSIVLWVQGTTAFPYLEQGELTEFADDEFLERIDEVFGPAFPVFAIWFN